MANRINACDVKEIITTDLSDDAIYVWVGVANALVTNKQYCIGGDAALLTKIELQLTAHYIGMLDPAIRGFITKEGPPGFETTYENTVKSSSNIDSTPYGVTANALANGCLTKTCGR
ncbi:unnamed protein product [marine sediment metagenome]|uniref:Uncharacterized protein n=1 Tax=marine sediment metagenome TaxID=412755 RepID=X1CVQ6_9ZZZZ